jgi:hypothetical protein
MDFNLKGKKYPITSPTDIFLIKIEKVLQNRFMSVEDDKMTAYVISKCCPSIPADLVSYQSSNEFTLNISSGEVLSFSFALTIGVLEKTEASNAEDKQIINTKIEQLKTLLKKTSNVIKADQLKVLSESIQQVEMLTETISSEDSPLTIETEYTTIGGDDKSQDEIKALKSRLADLEKQKEEGNGG